MTESRPNHHRPLSRLDLVVLARVASGRGASAAETAKALNELGVKPIAGDLSGLANDTLVALLGRGLVCKTSARSIKRPPPPRFKLTEAGHLDLRHALGVRVTPTWAKFCASVMPALALGEEPGSKAAVQTLRSVDSVLVRMLQGDRSLGEINSVPELCDRLVARALGMPAGPVTSTGISAYALAVHCGVRDQAEVASIVARFPPKQKGATSVLKALAKQLVGKHLDIETDKKAATSRSLARRWVSRQDESDSAWRPTPLRPEPREAITVLPLPSSRPEATESLLVATREAIRRVGKRGRYGKENVFVSALWQEVARDKRLPALSLDGYKHWLVSANRSQQLALARADLIDDMDASLVRESEIEDLGATFHFVLDRRQAVAARAGA